MRGKLWGGITVIALSMLAAFRCDLFPGPSKSPGRPESASGCHCSAAEAQAGAPPANVPTPLPRVHDPALAKEGDTYYLFSTGRGITLHISKDRLTWQRQGRVFADPISWTAKTIPGSTDSYWAPDISFFNGKWHLYYSVSTFGKNRSAVGLATNVTLNPERPDYRWKDEGPVVESKAGEDWNAIDPNLVLDEKKQPWLSFGSFWGGIKLVKIDPLTGKPTNPSEVFSLASRSRRDGGVGAIEAPFIIRHDRFYYLFVSFDFCCKGIDSTYNIRVGRAEKITGPYLDHEGKAMTEGGGTLVRAGAGRWRGPGHNAVYRERGRDWLVYHAYDADDGGASKVRIEQIPWDRDGWPKMPALAP